MKHLFLTRMLVLGSCVVLGLYASPSLGSFGFIGGENNRELAERDREKAATVRENTEEGREYGYQTEADVEKARDAVVKAKEVVREKEVLRENAAKGIPRQKAER